MKLTRFTTKATLVAAASAALLLAAGPAAAHCDGLDGPVVTAARHALDTGNVNSVLIWVKPGDEAQIKDSFRKTLEVRKLNASAKALADNYFFETLVRTHRAAEGAPYTGLKPAGRDLGPAVPAADKAIVTGSVEPVAQLLTHGVHKTVGGQFKTVMAKKNFRPDDVAAGRDYVNAYVEYMHSVERIYDAASSPAHGHGSDSVATAHSH